VLGVCTVHGLATAPEAVACIALTVAAAPEMRTIAAELVRSAADFVPGDHRPPPPKTIMTPPMS
jgi:hypothetical protein